MRNDLPQGAELELLKVELPILASKIASVVDTLWKIRTASISLWTAVVGVGLGSFTTDKTPVIPLLVLSCLLPVAFLNIDARNNRWYRRLSRREYAIQQYLNEPDFDGAMFPIYDIAATNTFRGSAKHAWEFSLAKSFIDPIPLSVYGGQLLFSAVACSVYVPHTYRWYPLLAVTALLILLVAWVFQVRHGFASKSQ